ncbi:hypothetical protein ACFUIY_40915 [Streptomyces griseorubiginosus]|uniref:hypothetical protein n=1 Tax=Streptomyces griseorubiginosus TaxID=67304 RepID=UPI0036252063
MTDIPRDADGSKLCAWCGGPIKQSGVGRSRDYCRRSCRQRAYERRQVDQVIERNKELTRAKLIKEFEAASLSSRDGSPVPRDSSRDEMRSDGDSSRDEMKTPVQNPVPAPQRRGRASGRPLLPPPPGVQRAEPLPLLGFGLGGSNRSADPDPQESGEG